MSPSQGFHFPNDASGPLCNYSINNIYNGDTIDRIFEKPATTLAAIVEPSTTVFAGDSQTSKDTNQYAFQVTGNQFLATAPPSLGADNNQGQFSFRHQNGANFVFLDGHVKWLGLFATDKRAVADKDKLAYFTLVTK